MVDASKILTVSYGTFSCTLEGFDDPFSTMRGIAEYFRDLAADDRYFGAEPPTPDAEMLHRIAEREIQNRVEARVEEDGITLRQMDVEPAANPTAPTIAAPQEAPEVIEPAEVEATKTAPESVAAKLARIRALSVEDDYETNGGTSENRAASNDNRANPISAMFNDVEEAEMTDDEEDAPEATAAKADPAQDDLDDLDDQDEARFENEIEVADVSDNDVVTRELAPEPDQDDLEMAAEATDVAEEMSPEETLEDDIAMDLANDEPALDGEPDDELEGTDTIASAIGASLAQDETEEELQSDEAVATPDSEAIARVVKMRRSDFEAAQDHEDTYEVENDDDGEDFNLATVISEVEEEAAPEIELEAEHNPEADISAVDDSSVDHMSEDTIEDDPELQEPEPEAEEYAAEETDEQPQEPEISTLSEEDEADLMATLEQVKRQEAADMRSEKEGRALLENQDIESSNESVSRILDVTNTELQESEGTRRRSAIAHLKAAVAATRADKFLGRKKADEATEEMDKYRDDLAKVVRPRRPEANADTKARLAPLVLVSEQRVEEVQTDAANGLGGEMIMPRRVMSGNLALDEDVQNGENIFRDGHSFAEFAAEMGAKELPDLLEAAAAFSSFIEGREHFSRPQIMKAVAGLNEDESYSREESLRSFGLLLRRGKIKKIKRGQFTIADTTRFNPEVRAVGE